MTDVLIMGATPARRDALARNLHTVSSIRVAGTAATFAFLRSLMDQTSADVAVIDTDEISQDWLEEIVDLMPVVLLAAVPDEELFKTMIRSERGALLRSDASVEQIVHAIEGVRLGFLSIDGRVVPERDSERNLPEELTPRETEVLTLLAEGLPNREIAARLDISEHTIKFHIRSILGK